MECSKNLLQGHWALLALSCDLESLLAAPKLPCNKGGSLTLLLWLQGSWRLLVTRGLEVHGITTMLPHKGMPKFSSHLTNP